MIFVFLSRRHDIAGPWTVLGWGYNDSLGDRMTDVGVTASSPSKLSSKSHVDVLSLDEDDHNRESESFYLSALTFQKAAVGSW